MILESRPVPRVLLSVAADESDSVSSEAVTGGGVTKGQRNAQCFIFHKEEPGRFMDVGLGRVYRMNLSSGPRGFGLVYFYTHSCVRRATFPLPVSFGCPQHSLS